MQPASYLKVSRPSRYICLSAKGSRCQFHGTMDCPLSRTRSPNYSRTHTALRTVADTANTGQYIASLCGVGRSSKHISKHTCNQLTLGAGGHEEEAVAKAEGKLRYHRKCYGREGIIIEAKCQPARGGSVVTARWERLWRTGLLLTPYVFAHGDRTALIIDKCVWRHPKTCTSIIQY